MDELKQEMLERLLAGGFITEIERDKMTFAKGQYKSFGDNHLEQISEDGHVFNFEKEISEALFENLKELRAEGIPLYIARGDDNDWYFVNAIPVTVNDYDAESTNGRRRVDISNSSVAVYLLDSNPGLEEILEELESAKLCGHRVWMAALAFPNQVEGQPTTWELLGIAGHVPPESPANLAAVVTQYDEDLHKPITPARAQELFRNIVKFNSQTDAKDKKGIPFKFVVTGCAARANEMCRLIKQAGAFPLKIWVFDAKNESNLGMATENHPLCSVSWSLHVAPAVHTTEGHYIIDPSVCDCAMPVEKWLSRFVTKQVNVYCTSDTVYSMSADQSHITTDPHYVRTNQDLRHLRISYRFFVARFTAPPYSQCATLKK